MTAVNHNPDDKAHDTQPAADQARADRAGSGVTGNPYRPSYSGNSVGRVGSWVVWHLPELVCLSVPAAVAVAVTPWAWLVAVVVAVCWVVREIRTGLASTRQGALARGADQQGAPADGVVG